MPLCQGNYSNQTAEDGSRYSLLTTPVGKSELNTRCTMHATYRCAIMLSSPQMQSSMPWLVSKYSEECSSRQLKPNIDGPDVRAGKVY